MESLRLPLDLPDLWQQDAVRLLREGFDLVVDAPTGAGKTRIFEMLVESRQGLRHGQAVYTVPTRALANDKRAQWNARGWNVGIATGDVSENTNAPILVATLETQRERFLRGEGPALLVIDEYQLIADSTRGLNYELAIATAPPQTQLLLLSGSVQNPGDVVEWLRRNGRRAELISVRERPVPLEEVPVESLPRPPAGVVGFWQRLAVSVAMADLSPLLIFIPRRREAEKIARQIADALPIDNAMLSGLRAAEIGGDALARVLSHRVAFHHSGLPYLARAALVEPLARAGHLRVIVATTGLAAGINFSVRSVLIAGSKYMEGAFERELQPDELLQMFGRAGRRGLDTKGVALRTDRGPRLADAWPKRLRRLNTVDWPTLLRVMEHADVTDRNPLEAAIDVCSRFFSRQPPLLGIEEDHPEGGSGETRRFGPTREEFLDYSLQWKSASGLREESVRLDRCFALHKDRWRPALRVPTVVGALGEGLLCRIPTDQGFMYGKALTLGRLAADDRLHAAPWLQKRLRLRKGDTFSSGEVESTLVPLLIEKGGLGTFHDLVRAGGNLQMRCEFSRETVSAWRESDGNFLIDPPRRRVALNLDEGYQRADGTRVTPARDSAAQLWRQLGLVDAEGKPTVRGCIVGRFPGAEGLMVAAALEEPGYPIEELLFDLANLRAGPRFQESLTGKSERLSASARSAFGHVEIPGYLHLGVCPGYGEGASEQLRAHLAHTPASRGSAAEIESGDLERVFLEWLSVLRHIAHAAEVDSDRWREMQSAARTMIARYERPRDSALEKEIRLVIEARPRPRTLRIAVQFVGR